MKKYVIREKDKECYYFKGRVILQRDLIEAYGEQHDMKINLLGLFSSQEAKIFNTREEAEDVLSRLVGNDEHPRTVLKLGVVS